MDTNFWTKRKIQITIAFLSIDIWHVMKNTILSKTKADININIPNGKCCSPCLQIDIYFLTNREKCNKTQNVWDKPNDTRDLKRFILVLCQLHIKRPEFEIICTLSQIWNDHFCHPHFSYNNDRKYRVLFCIIFAFIFLKYCCCRVGRFYLWALKEKSLDRWWLE